MPKAAPAKQSRRDAGPAKKNGAPAVCDLMIENGCILTVDGKRTIYPRGAIAISGSDIVAVGTMAAIKQAWRPLRTIDARGGIVHPGFIDTHVHTTLANSRGAFPDTLNWNDGMAFYAKWWNATEDEDEYASAHHAFIEMVKNGTTCVMETGTGFEPDVIADAMQAVGIRGLVADSWLYDIGAETGSQAITRRLPSRKRSLAIVGKQLYRNKDKQALVQGHVAVYGMGACSDELILAAKQTADSNGASFSMHQSFSRNDTDADDARLKKHPLVHFEEIGALGPNVLFTHMNYLRDDEVNPVVDSGMSITWCLTSSMIWGAGGTFHGRHDELFRRGVKVALGCDSGNSALRFDLTQQAVLTVLTTRDKHAKRDALRPEDALEMATICGAKAVGMADRIGSIEAGKQADIVIRSPECAESQPALDEVQGLILTQASKSVDTVLVNGEIVVKAGRCTRVDEQAAYAKLREFRSPHAGPDRYDRALGLAAGGIAGR